MLTLTYVCLYETIGAWSAQRYFSRHPRLNGWRNFSERQVRLWQN